MLCVWGPGHLILSLWCKGLPLLQDLLQVDDLVHGHAGVDWCMFQEDKCYVAQREDEEGSLLLSAWRQLYRGYNIQEKMQLLQVWAIASVFQFNFCPVGLKSVS
jgi:hypothetical protein